MHNVQQDRWIHCSVYYETVTIFEYIYNLSDVVHVVSYLILDAWNLCTLKIAVPVYKSSWYFCFFFASRRYWEPNLLIDIISLSNTEMYMLKYIHGTCAMARNCIVARVHKIRKERADLDLTNRKEHHLIYANNQFHCITTVHL